jgi:AcrR family transcriptional regulator
MTGIRSIQRQATRKAILSTARRLFLNNSFEGVGVREIAAEAGVATGTVIAAFGSKADLLNAIVIENMEAQIPLMEQAVVDLITTHDRVTACCSVCVNYHHKQIAIVRASMADAWTRSESADAPVLKALKPILRFIKMELERGVSRGEVDPTLNLSLVSSMLFDTILSAYRMSLYSDKDGENLTAILHERLNVLWRCCAVGA